MNRRKAEMTQNVLLEEGGSVSVHTRIKDMCKEARNRLGLTNQEISNLISEHFGIEDFSINTINNFFSERSKATTIYTTGYICAVLGISIDAVFGIESKISSEEEAEFIRQLRDVKAELRFNEQHISHLNNLLAEKDVRLEQAHSALEHYRRAAETDKRKVQPWVFIVTLSLLILTIVFIVMYLFLFDVGNPDYGLFHSASFTENELENAVDVLTRYILKG